MRPGATVTTTETKRHLTPVKGVLVPEKEPVRERLQRAWRKTEGARADGLEHLKYALWKLWRWIKMFIKMVLWYSWTVGIWRAIGDFAKWAYDYDSAALKAHHRRKTTETKEALAVSSDRRKDLRAHFLVVMAVLLPVLFPILAWVAPIQLSWISAFVVFCWVVKLIPGKEFWEFIVAAAVAGVVRWQMPKYLAMIPVPPVWSFVVVGLALLGFLGWYGRPKDKPILKGDVGARAEEKLSPDLIMRALTSLGHSKMSEKTQQDPRTAIQPWTDLTRNGPGVEGDFVLPSGVAASFVSGKREEFAGALRRPLGCVWPSVGDMHPSHLVVFITKRPMVDCEQDPWPLLKLTEVDSFHPLPQFTDQRGKWLDVNLAYASMVIGAVPRIGKTYVVRQILLSQGKDLRTKVAAIDGKGTGDLGPIALFADFYSRGDSEEELERVLAYLRSVKAEVRRRADVIDGLPREEAPQSKVDSRLASIRKLRLEPIVIGIDETQTYFEEAPEAMRKEFVELVTYLVKKGPALGVRVILATQQVTAKTIPTSISNNAVVRFCMKVEGGYDPNDRILGTGAYKRGIDANMFDQGDIGIGYLKAEGIPAKIVRSVWGLDGVEAEKLALQIRQARIEADRLTGQAVGEEMEREADQVSLLDELREMFGETTQKMSLAGIGGRLADRHPGLYGELTNSTTGALLRDLGLEPKPVRVDGVVEKGLERKQVFEAIATATIGPDEDGDGVVIDLPKRNRPREA